MMTLWQRWVTNIDSAYCMRVYESGQRGSLDICWRGPIWLCSSLTIISLSTPWQGTASLFAQHTNSTVRHIHQNSAHTDIRTWEVWLKASSLIYCIISMHYGIQYTRGHSKLGMSNSVESSWRIMFCSVSKFKRYLWINKPISFYTIVSRQYCLPTQWRVIQNLTFTLLLHKPQITPHLVPLTLIYKLY